MKRIGLFSVVLFFGLQTFAQKEEVKWLGLEEALALNKENPKKILIDVYTNWCYYCKVMDKKTYSNPKVANYINTHFYPVKFNAEQKENLTYKDTTYKYINQGRRGYNEFSVALLEGKLSYPTTVFIDQKGAVISRLPGYLDVKSFEPILKYIAENHYNTSNWSDFVNTYKNTF